MKLSVIIVNYNVRHFLEQCLSAVALACREIESEIIVVDNASVDGSSAMVSEKFPEVALVRNHANLGFSAANNQGIRKAGGEYILLLNPDTLVQEDCFAKCIAFMDSRPGAGAMGVKMIDGKGRFLPESKRSLPTPPVAFYKIFGLAGMFPRSRIFSRYHLGYLDQDEIHEVDTLTGAFLFLRSSALREAGLLDEDFFMYGEDIDLCYRIQKAGFRNYYYPGTTIIHYKGESTKKSTLNYVRMFYRAMVIFSRKHFSGGNTMAFTLLINTAIYFRAGLSILGRFVQKVSFPVLDTVLIYSGFLFLKPLWESYKFPEGGGYPPEYMYVAVPLYILTWLFPVFLWGGYDRRQGLKAHLMGIFSGSVTIIFIYSLLPEHLRYSRALVLMGSAWALFSTLSARLLLHWAPFSPYRTGYNRSRKILIAGLSGEAGRVAAIYGQEGSDVQILGFVCPSESDQEGTYLGSLDRIEEIASINRAEELVFCAADIPAARIILTMNRLAGKLAFRIAPPESFSLIGSNSVYAEGDLYLIHVNNLAEPGNRRRKRLLDIILSLVLLLSWPLGWPLFRNPFRYLGNLGQVLAGKLSFVGYYDPGQEMQMPGSRKGILHPLDPFPAIVPSQETASRANLLYAREFRILNDLTIIFRSFRKLDRHPSHSGPEAAGN